MPEPHRDDPLKRIEQLERESRVWKTRFFGALSGLIGLLLLGGLWIALDVFRTTQEVDRAIRQGKEHLREAEERQREAEERLHQIDQRLHQARREPEPPKDKGP